MAIKIIVPTDLPTFDYLWSVYPRRVAKKDALKAWNKLTPEQQCLAIEACRQWRKVWLQNDLQYCPHCATWLNGERWTDELPTEQAKPDRWWTSDEGVQRKGRQVGCLPRPGESQTEYAARVAQAVRAA